MSGQINKQCQEHPESYSPKKPEIINMVQELQKDKSYPSEFILPDKSTVITSETSHNCPGFVTFANEFSYFLDYSGQGYGFIHKDTGWRCDINYTLADIISGYAMRPSCLDVTPEGLERLYRTVGFPLRQCFYSDLNKEGYTSQTDMKEIIKYTLNSLQQPVILNPVRERFFGAVVVGYKDGGDILVTYGYPPCFVAPDNIYPQITEIDNWYQADTTLTVVGKRVEIPSVKSAYEEGLRQIRNCLAAGTRTEDRRYYDEWERFLRLGMDEMITEVKRTRIVPGAQMFSGTVEDTLTEEAIRERINVIVDPTWCEMAERRYYIMHFLYQASGYFPEEKDAFDRIIGHFGWSNSIMGSTYISEVGHDPVNAESFENPEVRARMADCVRQFRDADTKGLEMIEALLGRMGI